MIISNKKSGNVLICDNVHLMYGDSDGGWLKNNSEYPNVRQHTPNSKYYDK
jgi:hypothetical protein